MMMTQPCVVKLLGGELKLTGGSISRRLNARANQKLLRLHRRLKRIEQHRRLKI
jgi:hypothetical protein